MSSNHANKEIFLRTTAQWYAVAQKIDAKVELIYLENDPETIILRFTTAFKGNQFASLRGIELLEAGQPINLKALPVFGSYSDSPVIDGNEALYGRLSAFMSPCYHPAVWQEHEDVRSWTLHLNIFLDSTRGGEYRQRLEELLDILRLLCDSNPPLPAATITTEGELEYNHTHQLSLWASEPSEGKQLM